MECITIERLNDAARDPDKLITDGENLYADRLSETARHIYENKETRPLVLISGPSGSGKTTTAMRIGRILKDNGCGVHVISMDNYFLPMGENDRARGEDGKIDFESPYRLDIELFAKHLEKLFECEEIEVPSFDFALQKRKQGLPLKRKNGDIVILEGIHALNPLVTGDSDPYTTRVYVSVRTRLSDGERLLHPSKIRLMRRLMRDKLYRGRSLSETFEFFKSVERGENLYIMPFKDRADFDIDTFIGYEALVYRDILLPELANAEKEYKDYPRFADIADFLRRLSGLDKSLVPDNSLIREFVG